MTLTSTGYLLWAHPSVGHNSPAVTVCSALTGSYVYIYYWGCIFECIENHSHFISTLCPLSSVIPANKHLLGLVAYERIVL
jgi:hypothetical protein